MKSFQESPPILLVPGNELGEDYIITDTHGMYEHFMEVLHRVKAFPYNRLFIAGDIGDRGPASQQLFEEIIHFNQLRQQQDLLPQIYAVRGNHEQMLLDFYNAREYLKNNLSPELFANFEKIYLTDPNKANFYVNTELNNIKPDTREALDSYTLNGRLLSHKDNGGTWAFDLIRKDEGKEIASYIASLPIVISVDYTELEIKVGNEIKKIEEGFNLVHSRLPFSHSELRARLKNNSLTEIERYYAIDVRPAHYPDFSRKGQLNDPVTFAGHTIDGGIYKNHIILDKGACFCNALLAYEFKANNAFVVGDKKKAREFEPYMREIEKFMESHRLRKANTFKSITFDEKEDSELMELTSMENNNPPDFILPARANSNADKFFSSKQKNVKLISEEELSKQLQKTRKLSSQTDEDKNVNNNLSLPKKPRGN